MVENKVNDYLNVTALPKIFCDEKFNFRAIVKVQ